ncbi:conserved hypothetical protein [Ferroglobus placidus DSM 10642]|uniref:Uncharacterized protein n=1 Tax=Ferroglobus placidus (strain DSM 10642 / AEDII12DO) TaxID=589924 RepID=D3S0I7_FERPA|nr:hypothetical protein [Ferroglobus placidus]ADC64201.1 conserved hypothetical protein [Ferroglobus placidus DSM 10642]
MELRESVLVLLLKFRRAEEIARVLNVRLEDVISALNSLEAEGLVVRRREGLIFKKDVYELTERGYNEAQKLLNELKEISERIRLARDMGDLKEIENLLRAHAFLLSLLVTFGMIDLLMLSSLEDFVDVDFDFDAVEF